MFLESIDLTNFRNYEKLKLNLAQGTNIIIGSNATGKTNILESIYVLGLTKSFRTTNDKSIINNNTNYCKVKGKNKEHIYEFFLNEKEKIVRIDKNKITKISDYISLLNIIIYNPDTIEIIKGSPNERRKYLNIEISQLDNKYLKILNEFNKILKMRNDVLRKYEFKPNKIYLDIINEKFVEKSIYIYEKRFEFISNLNNNIRIIYKEITGNDNLCIKYFNNLGVKEFNKDELKTKFLDKLEHNLDKEINFGSSLYGPHKDDLSFFLEATDIKLFGSEGQKKACVLALKLSELEIFKQKSGVYPILLLDDIFSELDSSKKNNILKYINKNIQTIITTTDLKNFNKKFLKNSKIFITNNGKVEERC